MDTNRTEDLRVLRTHTLLLRALSDLLQEMSFDEIRVKDLCQRAMVHRSTFYAHFEDKVHLLTFGILELMEVFIPLSPTTTLDDYQRSMCRVFKHFQLETGTKISADQLAARFVRLIPNHIDIFPRDGTTLSPTELP